MKCLFRDICPIELFPVLTMLQSFSDNNYIVGGAVRDSLTGSVPKDWDVVTDIPMTKLVDLFEDSGFRVAQTGVAHFVLNVHFAGMGGGNPQLPERHCM